MELSQPPISHPPLPPMPLPIAPSSPIALLARDPLVGVWAAWRGVGGSRPQRAMAWPAMSLSWPAFCQA